LTAAREIPRGDDPAEGPQARFHTPQMADFVRLTKKNPQMSASVRTTIALQAPPSAKKAPRAALETRKPGQKASRARLCAWRAA
jgi:hypothetical protein